MDLGKQYFVVAISAILLKQNLELQEAFNKLVKSCTS